jgi:hypothetical protein
MFDFENICGLLFFSFQEAQIEYETLTVVIPESKKGNKESVKKK